MLDLLDYTDPEESFIYSCKT